MVSCTNLVVRVRFGPGTGPVIALNAHGDVVPPGAGWTVDPYAAEIRDGYLYGRGAAVSKSDFATYAFALLALRDAAAHGAALDGAVELHFTYDEEVGGAIGPQWLLQQKIVAPDFVISAGFSYAITTAHNGCLHLQVDVAGKSGHAALPDQGVDALEAATGILSDLYALRKTYAATRSTVPGIGSPTLVVGMIEGGINTNVVPDHVAFRIDRRIIPEESPAEAEATLTRQIQRIRGEVARRPRERQAHPARRSLRADSRSGEARRGAASVTARRCWARTSPPAACRSTPTRASTPRPASPPCCMAPGRARSPRPTGIGPTRNCVCADLHLATEVVARALADLLAPRPE